ncbi:MAG: RDD family protein [Acidobacteriota bacterium]
MQTLVVRRVVAYLVDSVVIFALFASLHVALWFGTGGGVHGAVGELASPWANWLWVFLVNTAIAGGLYLAVTESSPRAATLGKQALGIRIESEGTMTFGRAYLRALVKLVPWEMFHVALMFFAVQTSAETPLAFELVQPGYTIFNGLGWLLIVIYLAMAAFGQGRPPHDRISGTRVVRSSS